MGLIGDRKSKKAKEKEKEIERLKNGQNVLNKTKSPLKKGVMGGGGGVMVGRYPAGYYTTPNPQSSSWARENHHPNQPRHQPHLNPRYQTWVAPRKQQSLSSLVSGVACTFGGAHFFGAMRRQLPNIWARFLTNLLGIGKEITEVHYLWWVPPVL